MGFSFVMTTQRYDAFDYMLPYYKDSTSALMRYDDSTFRVHFDNWIITRGASGYVRIQYLLCKENEAYRYG